MIETEFMDDLASKFTGLNQYFIGNVNFVLKSPDEIRGNIKIDKYIENADNSNELKGTVFDPALGAARAGDRCQQCGQVYKECFGHAGYIELPFAMPNPVFSGTQNNLLTKVLNLLDRDPESDNYGRHYLDERREEYRTEIERVLKVRSMEDRVDYLTALMSTNVPQEEEFKKPKKASKHMLGATSWYPIWRVKLSNGGGFEKLYHKDIYKLLRRLDEQSDEHLRILGFSKQSRPSWMFIKALEVLPLCYRQTMYDGATAKQSYFTTKYNAILTAIEKYNVAKKIGNKAGIKGAKIDIYKNVFGIISFKSSTDKRKAGAIYSYIGGKTGLIKNYIYALRGGPAGRTVLVPNKPGTPISTIGVSHRIAATMNVPMTVTNNNVNYIRVLVRLRKVNAYRRFGSGVDVELNENNIDEYEPQPGDWIWRHLMNGDYVVMNRTPTLYETGFGTFEVKIVEGDTITAAEEIMPVYAADCDGDAVMLHVLMSHLANVEARTRMKIGQSPIHPSMTGAVYGLNYGTILAAFELSESGTRIELDLFLQMLRSISDTADLDTLGRRLNENGYKDFPRDRITDWSAVSDKYGGIPGRVALSATLPEDFYYQGGKLMIVDGIVVKGPILSSQVTSSSKSIYIEIATQLNPRDALRAFNNMSVVTHYYLEGNVFTSSPEMFLPKNMADEARIRFKLKKELTWVDERVKEINDKFERTTVYLPTDKLSSQLFTNSYKNAANAINSINESIKNAYSWEGNDVVKMIEKGGMGSMTTLRSITTMIGPYTGAELPIPERGKKGHYINVENTGKEGMGFCTSGYMGNIDPQQAVIGAKLARLLLIEKEMKTPKIGHYRKRIGWALDSIITGTSSSVRDAPGNLISGLYATHSLDPRRVQTVSIGSREVSFPINPKNIIAKINNILGKRPPQVDSDLYNPPLEISEDIEVGSFLVDVVNETVLSEGSHSRAIHQYANKMSIDYSKFIYLEKEGETLGVALDKAIDSMGLEVEVQVITFVDNYTEALTEAERLRESNPGTYIIPYAFRDDVFESILTDMLRRTTSSLKTPDKVWIDETNGVVLRVLVELFGIYGSEIHAVRSEDRIYPEVADVIYHGTDMGASTVEQIHSSLWPLIEVHGSNKDLIWIS